MKNVDKPIVTKLPAKTKSSVKIIFYPDFARFGIKCLENDHKYLFYRRTIDIAGTSNNKLKVFFNEEKVAINNFKSYIEMYYPTDSNELYFDSPVGDRWTVGVLYKPDSGGEVVSFVNSINTYRGGTHCYYIIDNIIKTVIEEITPSEEAIVCLILDKGALVQDIQTRYNVRTSFCYKTPLCRVSLHVF
jgi:DNA topoisomerase-2